jgi:putative oxidoreductase
MIRNLSVRDGASLVLRVGLAVIFILHGYVKVKNNWGTGWWEELGPIFQPVVAWTELIGGIALLLGVLTRLAALALICDMLGALYIVGISKGFMPGEFAPRSQILSYLDVGAEYNFALLIQCAALLLLGGGMLSVDYCLRRRSRTATAPPPMDVARTPAPTAQV